jgi:hypothetical protein
VIQEAYIQGVSTRSVDELVKAMGMSGISKSQIRPRLCEYIDVRVKTLPDTSQRNVVAADALVWALSELSGPSKVGYMIGGGSAFPQSSDDRPRACNGPCASDRDGRCSPARSAAIGRSTDSEFLSRATHSRACIKFTSSLRNPFAVGGHCSLNFTSQTIFWQFAVTETSLPARFPNKLRTLRRLWSC